MAIIRRRTFSEQTELPDDMSPLLKRIFAARGVTAADQIRHELKHLVPVSRLGGLSDAVDLLERHFDAETPVTVVGDFDADGATGSALLVRAFVALGFVNVRYLVPNRFDYGYGLTTEIVDLAARDCPGLIVTVDNGVTSVEGAARARELGIDVLVTDHHLPGDQLPCANAIVNPNLVGNEFPSKCLAGVGVAFYLVAALARRFGETGREPASAGFQPGRLLDLAALGTIADVVPLDYNNRILVSEGLERIRAGRCSAGITALLECAGRSPETATTSDLAFAVAPRLNAAGRLTDMSLGIECLLTDDPARALELARRLDELNRERRKIEARMQSDAMAAVEAKISGVEAGRIPGGLCLYDESWHPGVVGLVASRVKDRLHRPVVAFARDDSENLKGSGRSVAGCHIRDVLAGIATRDPGLIARFGGHAMAAGLTLRLDRLDDFRAAFERAVDEILDADELENTLLTDGELTATELTLENATLLRYAAPWGQAFPEPIFDGEFSDHEQRVVGERHLRLRVAPATGGPIITAIAFNQAASLATAQAGTMRLAYRLGVNAWRGVESLELVVEHMESA